MAESAGKNLLSALTEGQEKGNSKTTAKKGSKTSSGKDGSSGKGRNSRGGQTSKCKLQMPHTKNCIRIS